MNFTEYDRLRTEDMLAYLHMLGNIGWASRLQDEINFIHENDPDLTIQSKLQEIFKAEDKDDFGEIFENPIFQVLYVTYLFVIIFLFNTLFNVLLIHYEKFGADPMKRSLRNQLIAQTGYAQILLNMITVPVWSFRTLIGPLNIKVADIFFMISQSLVTW